MGGAYCIILLCYIGTDQVIHLSREVFLCLELIYESYICQYIELRAMSSQRSAIWLGVQGLLALVRVLIWVIDPAFDDLRAGRKDRETWHTEPFVSMSEEKLLLLRLSKLPLPKVEGAPGMSNESFAIPKWVLGVLDLNDVEIAKAFELAYSLYSENFDDPGFDKVLDVFRNAQKVWDFPIGFLGWWIEAHLSTAFTSEPQDHQSFIGCRIIEDSNGRHHYFPYHQQRMHGYQIFGDPRVEEKTIHTCVEEDSIDMVTAHRNSLQTGWPASVHQEMPKVDGIHRKISGLSLQRLNTKSTDASSKAIGMWDDLISILRREGSLVLRRRADFLKNPSTIGIPSKAKVGEVSAATLEIRKASNNLKSRALILPS